MFTKLGIHWALHLIVGFFCVTLCLMLLAPKLEASITLLIGVWSAVLLGVVASFTSCQSKDHYVTENGQTRVTKERARIFFIPVSVLNILVIAFAGLISFPLYNYKRSEKAGGAEPVGEGAVTQAVEVPVEDKRSAYELPTPVREWTDTSGRTMRASLHEILDGDPPSIRILKEDGNLFVLDSSTLDLVDRHFVELCQEYAQKQKQAGASTETTGNGEVLPE